MAIGEGLKKLLVGCKKSLPADLVATAIFTILMIIAVSLPTVRESVLRFVLGLAFVAFIPGYAFIAVLFPESYLSADPEAEETTTEEASNMLAARLPGTGGIDRIERAALAFGTSIAIVPLTGIGLSFTPWGIRLIPVIFTLAGVTLVGVVLAAYRRQKLPEDRQFTVSFRQWMDTMWTQNLKPDTRLDSVLVIVLAISVVFAFGTIGYAVAVPPDGEQFTDFYILTETAEGELVAEEYPSDLVAGEPEPIVVGLENNENVGTEYTIIVEIHNTTVPETNKAEIVDRQRVTTFKPVVEPGEEWRTEHNLTAAITGEDLRVTYLLYIGTPPAQPTPDNADQSLHLWVDVRNSEGSVAT